MKKKLIVHNFYLFDLKNGKKKLCYGENPEHALKILSYRLSKEEMLEINQDKFIQIKQREIQNFTHELG